MLRIKASAAIVFLCMACFVMYGVLLPGITENTGFLFVYPIYLTFWDNTLFVFGTWLCVYVILWFFQEQMNSKFDRDIYSLVNRSSMYCYIAHDFWQTIAISGLLPVTARYGEGGNVEQNGLGFAGLFIITLIFSEVMCILSYLFLEKLIKK
jgi:hypothetical protein